MEGSRLGAKAVPAPLTKYIREWAIYSLSEIAMCLALSCPHSPSPYILFLVILVPKRVPPSHTLPSLLTNFVVLDPNRH